MGIRASKTKTKPHDYKLNGKYFVMVKFCHFGSEIIFDENMNPQLKKPILYGFFFFKNKIASDNFQKIIESHYSDDPYCYIICSHNTSIIPSQYINKITFSFKQNEIMHNELFDVSNNINKLEIKGFNKVQSAINIFDKLFKLCSTFYKNHDEQQILKYDENTQTTSNQISNEVFNDFNYNLIDINTLANGPVNGSKLYLRFSENIYDYDGCFDTTNNSIFSNIMRTNDLMYLMSNTNIKIKNIRQENDLLKEKINDLEKKINWLESKL